MGYGIVDLAVAELLEALNSSRCYLITVRGILRTLLLHFSSVALPTHCTAL